MNASRTWRPKPFIENPKLRWGIIIGVLLYMLLALGSVEVNWMRIYAGLDRGLQFVAAFAQPNFTERWTDISEGLAESLVMTVVSTVIGIVISIPIALGASRNLAPLPIYLFCRAIITLSRPFQEVIIAILFVAIFGFGPFAGVLTISFATIGFLAKLLAEAIENIDPGQGEAVRSTGARWWQWLNV